MPALANRYHSQSRVDGWSAACICVAGATGRHALKFAFLTAASENDDVRLAAVHHLYQLQQQQQHRPTINLDPFVFYVDRRFHLHISCLLC